VWYSTLTDLVLKYASNVLQELSAGLQTSRTSARVGCILLWDFQMMTIIGCFTEKKSAWIRHRVKVPTSSRSAVESWPLPLPYRLCYEVGFQGETRIQRGLTAALRGCPNGWGGRHHGGLKRDV